MMNSKSPTLFITALFIFGSICLSSDTKRLSEAERLKLAIEIATQKPNRGIMIEQAEGYYTASFTDGGRSISPIGSVVDAIQPTIIQAVDGLMKTYDEPNNYPEPRVLNYQEVKELKDGELYLIDDDSLEKPTYGTIKTGKVLLLGETEYRDILITCKIYNKSSWYNWYAK